MSTERSVFVIGIALIAAAFIMSCGGKTAEESQVPEWNPVYGKIMTRWASEVRPDTVHNDYPRPQMERDEWLNLNGLWEYAIRAADEPEPEVFDGHILVPFPIESALSGVQKAVGKGNRLWYKRTFRIPKTWRKKRTLLNFEAADWETRVWVNGKEAGSHRGGYDPFVFDISDHLKRRGDQEIVVSVWDPVNEGTQPRGKQVLRPRGIWYTSVTGIWATVWLEPVPEHHIAGIDIVPDLDKSHVRVKVLASPDASRLAVELSASDHEGGRFNAEGTAGEEILIPLANPRLWSPDSPFLYDLEVTLKARRKKRDDTVRSYFGVRKISLGTDETGATRLVLNNTPLFHFGTLDQGWWPDGLYTAPSDAALRYDIEILKDLGFNMMRKHVKVEPRRFYYWCDTLGLLVWQDMPSGDAYIRRADPDIQRTEASARQFEREFSAIIKTLHNHPSVVMWVCFNEGWGQFDTERITDWVRGLDPTRLVDSASGWSDRGVGDVVDIHAYPGPSAPQNEAGRAAVLGEFGGLGLPVRGHTWQDEANWGYRSFATPEELTEAYLGLIEKLGPMIDAGLSAAVYTQTTDVEIEVNGLMTYNRAVVKMDRDRVSEANGRVYLR